MKAWACASLRRLLRNLTEHPSAISRDEVVSAHQRSSLVVFRVDS